MTFNANSGHFWIGGLSTSCVVAVPNGTMFNLVNVDKYVEIWRDSTNREWFSQTGWFTAATGGEIVDMTQTSFNGVGQTLFAQWESFPLEFIVVEWEITDAQREALISEALDGNGIVEIDMTKEDAGMAAADLPIRHLQAISEVGLGATIALPNNRSVEISAGALASIVQQAGGEDVTLEVHKQLEHKQHNPKNRWSTANR